MEQEPTRDRITIELTKADRELLDLLKAPLAKLHLDVTDGKVILGVFRRHGAVGVKGRRP